MSEQRTPVTVDGGFVIVSVKGEVYCKCGARLRYQGFPDTVRAMGAEWVKEHWGAGHGPVDRKGWTAITKTLTARARQLPLAEQLELLDI